ncbi:GNAT family N-acetyltransferase [Paenibacillus sp. DYY-L-2]|uniref:GNAT family N-acetyltransferase n=1 Tax=Paenibacillus sp. DYY-L-2 TaxID=3447013 RepID=UPI003F4F5BE0
MKITAWRPEDESDWNRQKAEILAFTQNYGGKRIPSGTYRALMKLSPRDLLLPGSSLLFATLRTEDGPRVAGLSCVTDYGRGVSLVIVHPLYRRKGLGSELLARQLSILGRLAFSVRTDHVPCLQMCFRAGLRASRLVKGANGRAELQLERTEQHFFANS